MIGSSLCGKIHRIESSRCCQCWCDSSERWSQYHLVVNYGAWAPRRKGMRKEIGKAYSWKHPRTPPVRAMFEDERAMDSVRIFIWVGHVATIAHLGKEEADVADEEESGLGPP